jgi:hypothetical protein
MRWLMKKVALRLSIYLSIYLVPTTATAQVCNVVGNSEITYNNVAAVSHADPFAMNYINGWYPINTPQIDTIFTTSPSAALCWANRSVIPNYYEGIFQVLPFALETGKPYIFSFKLRNSGGTSQVDMVRSYLTDSAFQLLSGNPPLLAPFQPVLYVPGITHTNYQQYTACNFIPTYDWKHLVIHPEQLTPGATQWASLDDVVLIPNFGFAGEDTVLCTPGLQVKLGTGACAGQFGATYQWYSSSNPSTILSTNPIYTFNPSVTDEYVLRRTIFGCDAYDTVLVEVRNLIPPDLGPDIVLCDSSTYMLHTPFNDSTWLLWEPMNLITWETNYLQIWHSGTYKVTISRDGCEMSDSVNITMLPEIEVVPDTIRTCGTDSVTFCATPGMASYYWSNGDTSRCITVYDAGIYYVDVTDTNGCVAQSFGVLYRGTPFSVSLGEDRNGCVDICETLSPTITGSSTVSNFTYLWSTSATTSSICVSNTGTYWVCVTDSLACTACDSIFVRIRQKTKPTANNIGPICLYDQPYTLSGHATPLFGYYEGRGVMNTHGTFKFFPRVAGVGTHVVIYSYTNDSGCTDTVNFTVTVIEGPYAELEHVQTCVTQTAVTIPLHTQSSIPGTWSTNAPNGEFDPSAAGPGVHTVSYTITDTITGCSYTAYGKVYVGQIYTATYTSTPPTGWLCEGKIVMHEATSGYRFLWENSGTQEVISRTAIAGLQANGTYNLYVWDSIGNCPPDMVGININYSNCCDVNDPFQTYEEYELVTLEASGGEEYYVPKQINTISYYKVLYFEKSILVPRGYTLDLRNCDYLMKGCTKILVENGARLILDNTDIGYCGWQGIEAGGWYDCCQEINSANCDLGNSCLSNSEVMVLNSRIHYADIALLSGYRADHTVYYCNQGTNNIDHVWSGGALLNVTGSIFSRNYIDILLREYDNEQTHIELSVCSSGNYVNGSLIHRNDFILPATQQYCNSISEELLTRINAITKCHIVDLAETSVFYQPMFYHLGIGGMGQNMRGNISYYSTVNFLSTKEHLLPRIYDNTYTLPCANFKLYK